MSDREDRQDAAPGAGAAGPGGWVIAPVSYIDPERRFCAYCGRPLGRRFWRVGGDGESPTYCDPRHAARDISQQPAP